MVNRWLLRLVSSDSYFKSFIIAVTLAVFSYLWYAN